MFSRAQSRAVSRGPSRAASTLQGRAATPMVNAETIESRIQPAVGRQWKKIQEQCRLWDVSGSGEIEVSQFKGQLQTEIFLIDFYLTPAGIKRHLLLSKRLISEKISCVRDAIFFSQVYSL